MTSSKDGLSTALGKALRTVRINRDLSIMELAAHVSGRTYISALERGAKQPTLGKIDEIARQLGLHPLSLLLLTYQICEQIDPADLVAQIEEDLRSMQLWDLGGCMIEEAADNVDKVIDEAKADK